MSRFPIVEYEDAALGVQAIYDEAMSILGVDFVPNWIKCMGSNETILRGNWEKTKGTLVEGELPSLLKELIIFSISIRRGSRYCTACHAHAALQLDRSLKYEDLVELAEGKARALFPPSFRVAIEVAVQSALDPNSIDDTDIERLAREGFSRAEIMELFAQADLAVMFNTITITAKLPIDAQYHRTPQPDA